MKKFVFFLSLALACMLVSSCKDVKPDFRFQLNLSGDVADSATSITGDFVVNVSNDANKVLAAVNEAKSETEFTSIAAPEGVKANDWLDKYIQDNVISEFSAGTEYTVHVKGYVHESVSGIIFSVDKTFTNR